MLQSPRTLFVIDGAGALLSALLLGVVLPRFASFFGMPREVLHLLAGFPVLFAGYDLFAYFRAADRQARSLRLIALANWGYCLLSATMVVRHLEQLTGWGLAYFGLEILVVAALAAYEWRTAGRLRELT